MKSKKELRTISEFELRKRLKGTMTVSQINDLLRAYSQAGETVLPDMQAISELAQKRKGNSTLKVSFILTQDEYDLLSELLDLEGKSGTQVVKKLVSEWISDVAE